MEGLNPRTNFQGFSASFILFFCVIVLFNLVVAVDTSSAEEEEQATISSIPSGGGKADSADNFIFTGAATHSIPIAVPPGRLGMAPNISLNYNSRQGNGWLGVGWILDLGSIQRSTKFGVEYDAYDFVYTKSGSASELVNYAGNEYRVKIENGGFLRFFYDETDTANPFWTAYDKSGKVYTFGSGPESRQDNPADTSQIFQWKLDDVEDSNGNYVTVTYTKDKGQIYLDRVDYTGNNNVSPALPTTNYVKFWSVADRSDELLSHRTKFEVITSKRLKTIEIGSQGTIIRAYKLTYDESGSTQRSLLSGVQQFGRDVTLDGTGSITGGTLLPATDLQYYPESDGSFGAFDETKHSGTGYISGWRFAFADVDGDGLADAIANYIGQGYGTRLHVALSKGDGFFGAFKKTTHKTTGYISGWNFAFADVNGDGLADAIANYIGQGYGTRLHVALSKGDGFFGAFKKTTHKTTGYGTGWKFAFADVNGDGLADAIARYIGTGYGTLLRVALSKGDGYFGAFKETKHSGTGYPFGWGFSFADVNGDGLADAIARYIGQGYGTRLHVALSKGDGYFGAFKKTNHATTGYGTGWKFVFADVNGDGLADAIARYIGTGYGTRLHVALSKGDGFFGAFKKTNHATTGYPFGWGFSFTDVNGDGKADAIARYIGTGYGTRLRVALSEGDIGHCLLQSINNNVGSTTTIEYSPSTLYDNTQLPFPIQTVSSITNNDGNGVVSTTEYTYANGYFDIADKEFRGFGYVKKKNPDNSTVETWFHQNHGTVTIDAGVYNTDEDFKGKPFHVEFREPWPDPDTPGTLLTDTDIAFDRSVAQGTYPVFVKLSQRVATSHIGGTPVTTTQSYTYSDVHGGVETVTTSGPDAENITTQNIYANKGFWLWRNTESTITGSVSGLTRKTTFEYEQTTGNMLWKQFYLDGINDPTMNFTYHPEGNLWTTQDARGNITTTTYDNDTKTFPVRIEYPITNGVEHIVRTEYDPIFIGNVKYAWDENGNKSENVFDAFGRVVETISYDGEGPSITARGFTEFHDFDSPVYVKSSVLAKDNGTTQEYLNQYEYFDGLGRTIQTITFGENNQSIVSRAYYDNMGRVSSQVGPFYSTGVGYPKDPTGDHPWSDTTYDYFGKPTLIESPDSTYGTVSADISYSGLSTTVTDPDLKKKTEKQDYLGRVVEVTEYGDNGALYKTTYEYNAAGDLLKTRDHLQNETIMTYDMLGRKETMTEMNMGFWQYFYDENGNLDYQIDAKGQIIDFTYDELNRVLTKTYSTSDPTVTYTYDKLTIPNGRGRLYSVSNTKVTTVVNSYDALGRAMSTTKTSAYVPAQNAKFTTESGFDLAGRLESVTYPVDNYQVTYSYYPGTGLIQDVTGSDNAVYASFSLYEATGKIGQIDYDNGTATRYTHDPLSTKLTAIVTTTPSPTGLPKDDIINKEYFYTKAGDVQKIIDFKKGNELGLSGDIFEYTYSYDNLHRLSGETTTNNHYSPNAYTYDELGNIKTKQAGATVMSYSYHPVKKHAVESITVGTNTYNFDYDANGNMISGHDLTDLADVASRQIAYNADNKPMQVIYTKSGQTKTADFIYDGEGGRVKKSVQGGSTTYYIGEHYEVTDGQSTRYIFANDMRIAKISGPIKYFYHKDHLNSSAAITDDIGNIVESSNYMPFGGMREHTGTSVSNYKYTDQEYDPETGLYYYGARYYDTAIGRFISPDSIVPDPFNPQAMNRYSYALNNPMRYIDPSGHGFWDVVEMVVGVVLMVVGAIICAGSSGSACVGGPGGYLITAGATMFAHGFDNLGDQTSVGAGQDDIVKVDDQGNVSIGGGGGGGSGGYGTGGGSGGGGPPPNPAFDNGVDMTMTFYITDYYYGPNGIEVLEMWTEVGGEKFIYKPGMKRDERTPVIRSAPGFTQSLVNQVYTDIYSFIHDDTPNARSNVFMSYSSLALEVGVSAGAGSKSLTFLQSSRAFRKYIFSSFPSELGRGYSFLGGKFKYFTHHVKHHPRHLQLEIFGKKFRPRRPESWNPFTWF